MMSKSFRFVYVLSGPATVAVYFYPSDLTSLLFTNKEPTKWWAVLVRIKVYNLKMVPL